MIIIYLILVGVVIHLANRDQKAFKLLFIPLLALSYFGTTEIYSNLSGTARTILLIMSLILAVVILILYQKDYKETKLNFLKTRRYEREALRKLKEKEPERTRHVTIKNMRTGEEKAYLLHPPKDPNKHEEKK